MIVVENLLQRENRGQPELSKRAGKNWAGAIQAGATRAGAIKAGKNKSGTTQAGKTRAGVTWAGKTQAGITQAGKTRARATSFFFLYFIFYLVKQKSFFFSKNFLFLHTTLMI